MKNNIKVTISILLIITIVCNFFLHGITVVSAASSYVAVAKSDVNMRRTPNFNNNSDGSSNIITEIDGGTYVIVVTGEKIYNSNCSSGWLEVNYNNLNGYVCSSYLQNPSQDTYDRPWNTPKRAIVGGAKWIANGYISKGQYTSYLKKFNVNPNANSSMYNHQYMTNIAAPTSESTTTYGSYKNNNMLELPFEFSIPVFLNMESHYDRPNGNLATIEYLDEVLDQEFETVLDKEGFPESYKRILRSLHQKHPTWKFSAMHTNANFTEAVNVEKWVCATNNSYQYDESKTPAEDPGWYRPSFAATAYYMDPRNFLIDKYIFQFESLIYKDDVKEELVQSIIGITFMKGNSVLDNQSYSSIFMEAGKISNVSSMYLASLARQEVGVNGGIATSGETFTYEGTTYQGLYNFYNIGATGGSSPVKKGLVYASGSYCTICGEYVPPTVNDIQNPPANNGDNTVPIPEENNQVVPSEPVSPPPQPIVTSQTSMNNLGIKLSNNYVKGFTVGINISALQSVDSNVSYSNSDIIKTGTVLKFADGVSYTAVVYGDLNGDGLINSADLLKLRQHLLGTSLLNGVNKEAALLNDDNTINSADLLKLRQYLLGQTNINQL